MRQSITFDSSDIRKFEKSLKRLGEKTTLKAAKKAAQKGSNVVGKAIRSAAPKGETGQLKHGFKKTAEKSRLKGKFVYQYAMDAAKNDVFQKEVKNVGKYGGKKNPAYYPASVEYGFLTSAGGGLKYKPGTGSVKHVEGTHFTKKAAEASAPAAAQTMKKVLSEELDKEWAKR